MATSKERNRECILRGRMDLHALIRLPGSKKAYTAGVCMGGVPIGDQDGSGDGTGVRARLIKLGAETRR